MQVIGRRVTRSGTKRVRFEVDFGGVSFDDDDADAIDRAVRARASTSPDPVELCVPGRLQCIPEDVVLEILAFLTCPELFALYPLCKTFATALDTAPLYWQQVMAKRNPSGHSNCSETVDIEPVYDRTRPPQYRFWRFPPIPAMLPFVRVNIGTENLADQLPPAVRVLCICFTDTAMVCKLACGLARLELLETVAVAGREAGALSMVFSHCQTIRRLEVVPFENMCNASYPRTLKELVLHEGYGCGWRAETARRLFERTAIERVVSLSGLWDGSRTPALDRLRARASADRSETNSETAYSRESDGSIMVRVTGDRSVSSLQWDPWASNGVSNVVLVSCTVRDFNQSSFGGQSSIRRVQITHPRLRCGFSSDGRFLAVLGNVGMWDVTWEPTDGPRVSVSCEHPLEEFQRLLAAEAASSDDGDDHESDGGSGTSADSSWNEENDTSEEEEAEEDAEAEEGEQEEVASLVAGLKGDTSADGEDGDDADDSSADDSSADDGNGKAGAADGGDEESEDEDGDAAWTTVDREWKEAN
jgi:hypothetical protein